jgi:hypothetical protein
MIKTFEEQGITAYHERSRSGKVVHVWVFFENPYPAFRSPKIFEKPLNITGSEAFCFAE